MAKSIEEKLKHCAKCKRSTVHRRNHNSTGLVMFLVHLVLTVVTMGVWLVLLVIYKIMTTKIGGWSCSECR